MCITFSPKLVSNHNSFITEGKEGEVRGGRRRGLQAGQEEQSEGQVRAGSHASKGRQESQKGEGRRTRGSFMEIFRLNVGKSFTVSFKADLVKHMLHS